ncbi:hypothetical protein [Nocardia sp. NPDC005978]|uniref:hypothetical protein n=1 Tax=unclassified Nocardia TaxID=2637762 RepID=UPI0033B77F26
MRRRRAPMVLSGLLAVLLLGACTEAEEIVNKGGDTPCSEFTEQSRDKQRITVRKYLEKDGSTSDPSPDSVDASITAIGLMCEAQANPDTPISNADLTGILVPKKN